MSDYPTESELQKIRTWKLETRKDVRDFLEYLSELWWQPGWGFKLRGTRVLYLELHTGGWSGNEDIVGALKRNVLFWTFHWQKSLRGGHFYFRIELRYYKRWPMNAIRKDLTKR